MGLTAIDKPESAAIYVVTASLGLAAGIQLLKKKRLGVILAKAYLVCIFLAEVGLFLLHQGQINSVIGMLIFVVIWLRYLDKSKRVRNTYGIVEA
jgi:hypothetical protein